jgi:hypothetical protein
MIARFGSAAILYVLGLACSRRRWASGTGRYAHVDAIAAITGGGRIEHAAALLAEGAGKFTLIAGADLVRKIDLVHRLGGKQKLFDCCVDRDRRHPRSNAEPGLIVRHTTRASASSPATGMRRACHGLAGISTAASRSF